MTENNEWSEVPENGITLGPEEALLREIEKNKALKVEKLRLKNEIEKLRLENSRLNYENQNLNHKLTECHLSTPQKTTSIPSSKPTAKPLSNLLISIATIATFVLFLFFLFF